MVGCPNALSSFPRKLEPRGAWQSLGPRIREDERGEAES